MSNNATNSKLYKTLSIIITVAIVILVLIFIPQNLPFWLFTTSDIVSLLIGLFLIALFIERTVEVFTVVWRDQGKQKYINEISSEKLKPASMTVDGKRKPTDKEIDETKKLEDYGVKTKSMALKVAFALGIAASAFGIRVLQPLIDPAIFKQIGIVQKAMFTVIDILITGALLGGGSEGIHKILDVFLSTAESYRKKVKKEAI